MAFRKTASLDAQVLGVKGSSAQRTASLDKFSDFEDFKTEDGFLYARIRAISSRVNKNWDGWPSIELAGSPEVFEQHTSTGGFTVHANKNAEFGFSTFLGKPIFVDHHNSDPSRARGVVVDAKFHVDDHKTAALDSYYSSPDVDPEHLPGSWVELLLEVDAKQFPRLARAIVEGSRNPDKGIDGFSMGCDVERSVCSICKNSATAPDEFCNHIKLKGHEFKAANGKTSKSYENCYGVKFFEISAVFDPADETALLREVRSSSADGQWIPDPCPHCRERTLTPIGDNTARCGSCGQQCYPMPPRRDKTLDDINQLPEVGDNGTHEGSTRFAENDFPQADHPHAPTPIDTLREEKICPVCGSTMDDETCEVCSYVEPPEPFQNPDLQKAQESDLRMEDAPEGDEKSINVGNPDQATAEPKVENSPRNPGLVAHVTDDMDWEISLNPRVAGRINTSETPVIAGSGPATDEPVDIVIKDQTKPVTSRVRTASEFIAAAGRNKENTMSNERVAAEPIPGAENQSGQTGDHDETRVDVTGVGGVDEASNEQASQADKQVDVQGVGGTGEEAVKSDKTVEVAQGDEHSKNIEAIPTKTFPNDGQHDPVTNEVFEGAGKQSGWQVQALDAGPYPEHADGAAGDGAAVQGTQPADPVGNAEERVNVLDSTTSPENNSGPTTTWSGTDGNGVTKQQDPVTTESISQGESGMHNSSHIFTAFKLADLEVEIGLLDEDKRYERAAELEKTDPAIVQASLKYAQRVRTASKKRVAATRLPVLGRQASTKPVEASQDQVEKIDPDFALGA